MGDGDDNYHGDENQKVEDLCEGIVHKVASEVDNVQRNQQ